MNDTFVTPKVFKFIGPSKARQMQRHGRGTYLLMSNHVIHVKSCYSCQIISNHVIHVTVHAIHVIIHVHW
jgi:hypothetical protein